VALAALAANKGGDDLKRIDPTKARVLLLAGSEEQIHDALGLPKTIYCTHPWTGTMWLTPDEKWPKWVWHPPVRIIGGRISFSSNHDMILKLHSHVV
jgi:hypothetical protein